jgi:hypothetical protein
MIHFKCKECGSMEHSSCIQITPCQDCGGEIEVWELEEEDENSTRNQNRT